MVLLSHASSSALPSLHPGFGESFTLLLLSRYLNGVQAIPTVNDGGNHTPEFEKAAGTIEAHYACLDVSKALAATGVRVLIDDKFFTEVGPYSWNLIRAAITILHR